MIKTLLRALLFILGTQLVSAKTPLTPEEISAIEVTAKAFVQAFKDNDPDLFQTLLIPPSAFADTIPDHAIRENTYRDLMAVNVARFKEWRGIFADLKKYDAYWTVSVIPGERSADRRWISPETIIHNTFVELRYSNRIKITLKLEHLALAGEKCHIIQID